MNDKTKNQEADPPQTGAPTGGNNLDEELGKLFMSGSAPQAEPSPEINFAAAGAPANVPDDGPAKIWMDVPNGSVLELRVPSQNPSAAAIARLSTLAGKVEFWSHQVISPGPKARPITSVDQKYVLNVIVAFDGDHPGKVGIVAKAIHNGTVVRTYFHVVSGTRGDIKLGKVLIDMQ
jgi:hypothetical protein